MNIFLDTNVIIDYMAAREPFCHDIRPIIRESATRDYHFMVAPMTFTTMEYILHKHVPHQLLMESFRNLRQIVHVIPTTSNEIDYAIDSRFTDFEDAVQHFTAHRGYASVILTRNKKDYEPFSTIEVLTPKEFA